MGEPGSAFWFFSLSVYRQPGVPDACLVLQDGAGADVNLVLFLLWHAAEGRALGAADVAAIEAMVGEWRRSVVVPLREARRALKARDDEPAVAALRRQVKQSELEAERLQQELLFASAATLGRPVSDRGNAARESLSLYAAALGEPFDAGAVNMLIDAAIAKTA
jgi:uncharacterized protein (TIGR02444 family)